MAEFKTSDAYQPTGDQPQAITTLSESLDAGERYQTLLGATGTGKTATMAWIIEKVGRPALLIAHNKTLAAQLCNELREFFPNNAVEYFVSYYDYYQPEAYVPQADLYIEKDSSQNDDIARLRLAATSSPKKEIRYAVSEFAGCTSTTSPLTRKRPRPSTESLRTY